MSNPVRYLPALIAGVGLVGCLLPFGDASSGHDYANLLALPDAYAQASKFTGMMSFGDSTGESALPVWIARLVYLVPLAALAVIVQTLRGRPGRGLQALVAATWVAVPVFVPYLASRAMIESIPVLREMSKVFGGGAEFSVALGTGGWVLVIAAILMTLSALNLLRQAGER